MELTELKKILQENGIVGAGGAGFPTYAKLDERIETIILNCSECEPLLKLHRQLLKKYAYEITMTLSMMADVMNVKEVIIGVKEEYKDTIMAVKEIIDAFPFVKIALLENSYPMGDEVVLIYETVHKIVRPGSLPLEEGIAVFNVETIFNVYQALEKGNPVTSKLVSVVAEVEEPVTVRVPIGCTIEQVAALAGGATTNRPVYMIGGPMMGSIGSGASLVTKTTNAVLVLPEDHVLVKKKNSNHAIDLNRAASCCCQCQACTDLCPRNALGHPVAPHQFMRAAAWHNFLDLDAFTDTFYCSSCGLCELYACPQGLSPRTLMADFKAGLKKAGVKPLRSEQPMRVHPFREDRKIQEKRLMARTGLSKYDKEAPFTEEPISILHVKILLSQHIGVPAQPIVEVGMKVREGQMIAKPADALSVAVHASIAGTVTQVCNEYIEVQSRKLKGWDSNE